MARAVANWMADCGVSFPIAHRERKQRLSRERGAPRMPQRDPEQYTLGDDGLIFEKVGSWASEKLKLVTDYVYASGGARKKYLGAGAAYIDPFCGSGRSLIRGTTTFIEGSPVAVFKRAVQSPGRFTSINISDGDEELLAAATKRLTALSAPVCPFAGPASESIP